MNLINIKNEQLKTAKRAGLMTHVVAGYPNIEETRKIILLMVELGVDFVEIQIPFSDPLGDGSTIRVANTKALENGFKVKEAFELVKKLREEDGVAIPLLFMTYFNIVHHYGVEKFCLDSAKVGIDGLIIPDYNLKAESRDRLKYFAEINNLHLINFVSLDSDLEYIGNINKQSRGFVYCFSSRSVTGGSQSEFIEIINKLNEIKNIVELPLAVGFGVSSMSAVQKLAKSAQIIIVGSAILRAYEVEGLAGVRSKISELKRGLSTELLDKIQ